MSGRPWRRFPMLPVSSQSLDRFTYGLLIGVALFLLCQVGIWLFRYMCLTPNARATCKNEGVSVFQQLRKRYNSWPDYDETLHACKHSPGNVFPRQCGNVSQLGVLLHVRTCKRGSQISITVSRVPCKSVGSTPTQFRTCRAQASARSFVAPKRRLTDSTVK